MNVGVKSRFTSAGVGNGLGDVDFAALIELQARAAGYEPMPEGVPVRSGLENVNQPPITARA